jgi:long-chain acyl-CoA synthetase
MFNSGGENIYPLEVENLLLKHSGVADVSVVPFPHKIKGDVPVAMVVRASDATVDEDELKQFALQNGPAYAHPRRILFVDRLPLNGAAKTDRKVVEAQLREILGDAPLGAA